MQMDFNPQEINVTLRSIKNCMDTCHDGGAEEDCPDCRSLRNLMSKMQAGLGL